MGVIVRGWRNVYRSKTRFILTMFVLALSAGVGITMVQVSLSIRDNLQVLAADYLTLIEVRKAGATGMGVGVAALPQETLAKAERVPGVTNTEEYLLQRMVYPERAARMSILVGLGIGATPRLAIHGELNNPRVVAGRALTPNDAGKPLAVVGKAFAEYFDLAPGSRFTLRAENVLVDDRPDAEASPQEPQDMAITVIGIFESGFLFGDNQLFMPLDTVQKFAGQEGKISHVYARAASAGQVSAVEDALWDAFGGEADVISGGYLAERWSRALRELRLRSLVTAGISLAAGILVTVFIMMLITRERIREIGILKALGATNRGVAMQFAVESLTIAVLGGVLGLLVFVVAGARLSNALLGVAASAGLTPATAMGGENPVGGLVFSYAASPIVIALTFALIVVLALAGGLYPVLRGVRLRPVEAIRAL